MTDIVDDVKPATGEEAAQLQQNVMKAVTKEFGGDQERLKGFTTNTKAFGNGALSAATFMAYMRESFGATRAERFTPSLARLISDPEKRRQLLAAARQRPAVDEDADSGAAAAGAGLSQQLQQLAIAHREGVITEEQKASAKDELIRRSFQESDSGTSPVAQEAAAAAAQSEAEAAARQQWVDSDADGDDDGGSGGHGQNTGRACDQHDEQPATVAAAASGAGTAPPHAEASPELISMLNMGFERKMAEQALAANGGDVEAALEYCLAAQEPSTQPGNGDDEGEEQRAVRGWLVKSDPSRSKFQKRYFVLRHITGSLCYYGDTWNLHEPKGVIDLFNSRLARAWSDKGLQKARRSFSADGERMSTDCGFELITPHRTYQLYAPSTAEANMWWEALGAVQEVLVPEEFTTNDMIAHEVFENERYAPMKGWGGTMQLERGHYSDRQGDSSSEQFPQVRLPRSRAWEAGKTWEIDLTYTACDEDGWSYARSFSQIEDDLAKQNSCNSKSAFGVFVRRRRWTRTSVRVAADVARVDGGGATHERGPSESDPFAAIGDDRL